MSFNKSAPPPPPPPAAPPSSRSPLLDRGPPPPPPKALQTAYVLESQDALDRALSNDDNILARIEHSRQREIFWNFLQCRRTEIEAVVSFHLCLKTCQVADVKTWISGSFNVCIPVFIDPPSDTRVIIRIPLPYKVGEAKCPGNVDEKLRCEVASYLWIQENCPDIEIPRLFGCGFPDGSTFTSPEYVPLLSRLMWYTKRAALSWLRFPTPCRYVSRRHSDTLKTGYIIISYVTNGHMLSQSWETLRNDKTRRTNLFHDLARISLSLNRFPLPCIGSLTIDNRGIITLTNRPLTLRLQSLENEGIPTGISRKTTYPATDLYLLDLLTCHDNRIHHQPNSIHNEIDGRQQLAALTMMRATLHHFTHLNHRYGKFFLRLTDVHQSNIFVDDEGHITSLIDLEWACAMPIELHCPPYWLSGRYLDEIEHGEPLEKFGQLITEFFDAFEYEERFTVGKDIYQTPIMRNCWKTGSFWYFQALQSPKGLYEIFNEHIQRLFCPEHCNMRRFDEIVARYWSIDAEDVIKRKIKEEQCYKDCLREAFNTDVSPADLLALKK